MAKRFTDNEKWQDNWFTDLTNDQKIIWIYLLDHCDNAGLWKVNIKNLNYFCSTNISVEEFIFTFKNRLTQVKEDLFLINKFCLFQYGPDFLSSKNKAVLSAINKLIQVGIINEVNGIYTPTIDLTKTINTLSIPYTYPIDTPKEKEEEKVIVKNEEQGMNENQFINKVENNKLVQIMKQVIEDGLVEEEEVANWKICDTREKLNYIFQDYSNWEQDLLKLGFDSFIRTIPTKSNVEVNYIVYSTLRAHEIL